LKNQINLNNKYPFFILKKSLLILSDLRRFFSNSLLDGVEYAQVTGFRATPGQGVAAFSAKFDRNLIEIFIWTVCTTVIILTLFRITGRFILASTTTGGRILVENG
jgi:hypothetical protein